ncbi:MAG: hypothetical protein IIY04_05870, partial [Oscillospiraceae bacterium]|nr:hypothetical protein [Oscillospiraceae bacterium]
GRIPCGRADRKVTPTPPKIDILRKKGVDFYFLPLTSSLFTKIQSILRQSKWDSKGRAVLDFIYRFQYAVTN